MKLLQIVEGINKVRAKFYEKITNFKVVKYSVTSVMLIYIPLLIIGCIVAAVFDPDGYTIWTNWISDLGSINHTPAPYLYDIACIIAGIMTVPFTFYMENFLAALPKNPIETSKFTRFKIRLASYAFLSGIIGNLSYIGVGIFSADRDFFNMHNYTSTLAFGGFILATFFMGWLIILYRTGISKIIGVYGVFGPLTVAIIYLVIQEIDSPLDKLFEWMMLFAILAWIIPLALDVFHIEKNRSK